MARVVIMNFMLKIFIKIGLDDQLLAHGIALRQAVEAININIKANQQWLT